MKMGTHILSAYEGKKMFGCEICGKSLTTKKTLAQHISTIHEGNKQFKCDTCDYSCSLKKDTQLDPWHSWIPDTLRSPDSHTQLDPYTLGALELLTQLDPYTVRSLDPLTQLDPYTVRSLHIQILTHLDP